jgi:hypothetical protein
MRSMPDVRSQRVKIAETAVSQNKLYLIHFLGAKLKIKIRSLRMKSLVSAPQI